MRKIQVVMNIEGRFQECVIPYDDDVNQLESISSEEDFFTVIGEILTRSITKRFPIELRMFLEEKGFYGEQKEAQDVALQGIFEAHLMEGRFIQAESMIYLVDLDVEDADVVRSLAATLGDNGNVGGRLGTIVRYLVKKIGGK